VITASTLATIIAVSVDFSFAEVISTVLLSIIVLIFCEITPKTAAVQNPERVARFLLRPLEFVSAILKYVVIALTGITNGLLRLFGVNAHHRGPFMTEDELRLMVEVGKEEGVLEEDEREMIHNVFDLGDTAAREVMVPRIDMVTVEADDALDDATQIIMQGGFSRIPVYDDSINDIIGVLYAKDLLRVLAGGQAPQKIRQLPLRSAYFVPESKRLDDLLHEMQRQRVHMAVVVDEYGAVVGLVTIEDVVEEIIGDIKDEYDKEEQIFEQVSDTEFLVDAKISVDDLNERIDADLPAQDYDTLGGFVYTQLDKIPAVGDVVTYKDLTITVLGTKGRRVTKVKIVRESGPDASGSRSDHLEAVRGESERSRRESRETRGGREPQTQDRAQARDHIAERLR
ncbi:MAG: hemolysin family protein, partial [Ktedonobacterales bacterium]